MGYIVKDRTRLIPVTLGSAGTVFFCLIQVMSTMGLAATGFVAGLGHGRHFPGLIALTIRPIAIGYLLFRFSLFSTTQ
jgi:hypothetical protein